MPHICADEILMIMTMVPFIGIAFRKVHSWYHIKFDHKCHQETCDSKHVEHNKES